LLAVKKFETPEDLGKEISVLQFLRNAPNIVKFQGVVFEPGNFWLLTSLVSKCLCSEICSGNLSQSNNLEILHDVANALTFMHSCNLGHLDLKSPNVLLEISSSGRAKAVLCDFGNCALLEISGHLPHRPRPGTFGWAAPETLRLDEPKVSLAADVWSFGVLIWEISVHQQPWCGLRSALVIAAVGYGGCGPEKFQGVGIPENSDIKRLADQCLVFDPCLRPKMKVLLEELKLLIARTRKLVDSEISCFFCGG
jgi:serine/threonine protein kinase